MSLSSGTVNSLANAESGNGSSEPIPSPDFHITAISQPGSQAFIDLMSDFMSNPPPRRRPQEARAFQQPETERLNDAFFVGEMLSHRGLGGISGSQTSFARSQHTTYTQQDGSLPRTGLSLRPTDLATGGSNNNGSVQSLPSMGASSTQNASMQPARTLDGASGPTSGGEVEDLLTDNSLWAFVLTLKGNYDPSSHSQIPLIVQVKRVETARELLSSLPVPAGPLEQRWKDCEALGKTIMAKGTAEFNTVQAGTTWAFHMQRRPLSATQTSLDEFFVSASDVVKTQMTAQRRKDAAAREGRPGLEQVEADATDEVDADAV